VLSNDFRKPISYYVQSFYSEKPMVHIGVDIPDHPEPFRKVWIERDMLWKPTYENWNLEAGRKVKVFTYTNCEEVELFLNNESLGVKKLKDFKEMKMHWDVDYKPGTLKAVGLKDGDAAAEHQIKSSGEPARMVFKPESKKIKTGGRDLCFIKVMILDKAGNKVPEADNQIKFKVTGAGKIAGLDSGNLFSNEKFVTDRRRAYRGRLLLVIRADRKPGKITVLASSKGLPQARMTIKAV
jgi:beta-galactosidase